MTGPLRGTQSPPTEDHNVVTPDPSKGGLEKDRFRRAPDRLMRNTISVDGPDRLMDSAHTQRQLRFQYLVRRYISQIQFGCKEQYCTTPTCLSCKRRLTSKPFRVPTPITARTLAYFLASQNNPYAGLCPHDLKISPSALEIGDGEVPRKHVDEPKPEPARGYTRSRMTPTTGPEKPLEQAVTSLVTSSRNPDGAQRRNMDVENQGSSAYAEGLSEDTSTFWNTLRNQHQAKKDNKSLGQNVFDTVSVIYSYSKHLPSPLDVFNALSRSHDEPLDRFKEEESQTSGIREPRQGPKFSASNSDAANRSHPSPPPSESEPVGNGHAVHPGGNGRHSCKPAQTERCHSHSLSLGHYTTSPRKHQKPSIADVHSENLADGQKVQLCKIKQRLPQHLSNGQSELKTYDSKGVEGTEETKSTPPPEVTNKRRPPSLPLKGSKAESKSDQTYAVSRVNRVLRPSSKSPSEMILPVTSHLSCDIMDDLANYTYHQHSGYDDIPGLSFIFDYDKRTRLRRTMPFVNRSLYYTLSDPDTLLRSFREESWKEGGHSPLPHMNPGRLSHAFQAWNKRNGSLVFDSLWIATKALFTPPPELVVQKSPRLRASLKPTDSNMFANPPLSPSDDSNQSMYLSDLDAVHIIMICIHALTSSVPNGWPHAWSQIRKLRSWGVILPQCPTETQHDAYLDPWIGITDELEYEPALRLSDRLVRGIAARRCFSEILKTLSDRATEQQQDYQESRFHLTDLLIKHLTIVEGQALASRRDLKTDEDPGWTVTSIFLEWLRTIIIMGWDGKAEVHRWSAVGGAIEIMADLYERHESLSLYPHMFYIPYLNERIDQVETPTQFLNRSTNPNTLHLLSYPFLFFPRHLVSYFRTVNYANMYKQYEVAERTSHFRRQLNPFLDDKYWWVINQRMKIPLAQYLVLDVSRTNPLQDAFNQLWGLEKRQFLKPLKVKMGADEGEVGVDQGGVSLEFFRVILSEVFNPDNGMFNIDPETRMTWFQPASLEPLYRFELIGLLFSLAIYNGVMLPITFPKAFYRRLLNKPVTSIDHIRDGWPSLAKAFEQLRSWSNGDVGDVFTRTYSFSFEAFGQVVHVDMEAFDREELWPADLVDKDKVWKNLPSLYADPSVWPENVPLPELGSVAWERPERRNVHPLHWNNNNSDAILNWMQSHQTSEDQETAWEHSGSRVSFTKSKEASLVTNENRDRYIDDYIFWLTDKSIRPQFEAFTKGFFTCIDRAALQIFSPETLQTLIEGHQEIEIAGLQRATRYEEGYSATHPLIVDFWALVATFDAEAKQRLLEFVTASDRVPVNGFESIQFSIVRVTGDTEMLPTSSTCFGKLLLPEYADREKLERKLRLALQNSKGFGAA